ncbi:MAG: CvpA family protein [Desulfuromonadales bacterium]|nr:CvpA family protein [Desulfuromonadales bacterium]
MEINLVDILIWLVLLGFIVKGFQKGLLRELCALLGILLGGWAALHYYVYLAKASRSLINLPLAVASFLSFIFIFLIVAVLLYVLGYLLTAILKILLMGPLNRGGGVVFGFLEGALIICLALYLGTTKPMPEKFRGYLSRSKSAHPFIVCGEDIVTGWDSAIQAADKSSDKKVSK